MAKNHLSEAATQGRYGDNILVHMNKDEAAVLAKSAGLDELPINPKTGLPEAWFFTALAVGLGAYSAWKGGKEKTQQAGTQSDIIAQQQEEAEKAKGLLDPLKRSQIEVALGEFEEAGQTLGIQKQESVRGLKKAMERTGLVTAAGLEEKKGSMWKQFAQQEEGLHAQFASTMANIEEGYEGEKMRIDSESRRLGLQKKLADKQSGSWYLGKNIFG
jgi:predicted phage tail protein